MGPHNYLKKVPAVETVRGVLVRLALTAIEKQCVSCLVWTQGATDAYVWPKQLSKKCFQLFCMA